MKVFVLLLVFTVIGQSIQTEGDKLCGRNLSITLAALCKAKSEKQQYSPLNKRTNYNSIPPYYEPYWLEPSSALRLGRGKRGGIVEECCTKTCTLEELLDYCP